MGKVALGRGIALMGPGQPNLARLGKFAAIKSLHTCREGLCRQLDRRYLGRGPLLRWGRDGGHGEQQQT